MNNKLEKARAFESEKIIDPKPEVRPLYHFTPPVGWLNDPNGFSWYQGQYHLFYQYYPYDTKWGEIHWGHAVSRDLLLWEYLPAAMAPDEPYDRDGCFSGSAVTMKDGRHLLMYTGFVYDENDPQHRGVQSQNIAIGNGVDYVKCTENPVIRFSDVPDYCDRYEFRDPKVWIERDGTYRVVIAAGNSATGARIVLFRSNDGMHWEYAQTVTVNDYRFGEMWECPDLFHMDSTDVLLFNAMNMKTCGMEFHDGNNGLYILGKMDFDPKGMQESHIGTLDHGMDFYAGQTLLSPDGRRILIGWMQNPGTVNFRTVERSYFGQMSVPRELRIQADRLLQWPIREVETFRCDPVEYRNVILRSERKKLSGIKGRTLDMEMEVHTINQERPFRRFEMRFAQSEDYYSSLVFESESKTVTISREHSGADKKSVNTRKTILPDWNAILKLRILLDYCSAEVFLNDGDTVFSMTLETEPEADDITFISEGDLILHVKTYKLDPTITKAN